MKKIKITIFFILSLTLYINAHSEEMIMKRWDNLKFGNHRAVVYVDKKAEAVVAKIEWRRRDKNPEKKRIIVVDSKTGTIINEVVRIKVNPIYGIIVFKPYSVPAKYYIYYLPYKYEGSKNYPKTVYLKERKPFESEWYKKYSSLGKNEISKIEKAKFLKIESSNDFNSFTELERIASKKETEKLIKRYKNNSYLLFPEKRDNIIRMFDHLPYRWIKRGLSYSISLKALKGEYLTFQIAVFPIKEDLKNINIEFSPLIGKKDTISSERITCFNTDGINLSGKKFSKKVEVKKGKVLPLWFGIDIKENLKSGVYSGFLKFKAENSEEKKVKINLFIENERIENRGDNQPQKLTRLRWLNSRLGSDGEPVKPYTPIKKEGRKISVLGRKIILGKGGFPESIISYFSDTLTKITPNGENILREPVAFCIKGEKINYNNLKWEKVRRGVVEWSTSGKSNSLKIRVKGKAEYEGFMDYKVELTALKDTKIDDVLLKIIFKKDKAKYMMGLGFKGGKTPEKFLWKWDKNRNQDSVWIGAVNGGLQIAVRGKNYIRPLNTNFYHLKPLNMPVSWYNNGKGGFELIKKSDSVIAKFFSRKRVLKKGETLHFYFSLLITPFKTINTKQHWKNRYFHAFKPLNYIKKMGANIINVHHATEINPFINYPFLRPRKMKAYIDKAHKRGMKVKIYYTVRELSNHAPEIFALKSLGGEIFAPGKGGGPSWLVEHFGSNYIAGWFVPKYEDAAIINNGQSRWHNYYIEGLNWLVKNVGIDGLYIDDIAFDRTIMKRIKRVFEMNGKEAIIDVHSANQYNPRDGFASSANLYLEHFPFIDRLWFGEYFDYDSNPDYWLIEISGIPFGLMGEMLQNGGNPYRGMLYGMTARLPWAGDPRPLWKLWDDFGIDKSEMIGYWSDSSPVKTDKENILATVYKRKNKALIAIASWEKKPVKVNLIINWKKFGMNKNKVHLYAPYVKDFQPQKSFAVNSPIPVLPKKGWLLILEKKE